MTLRASVRAPAAKPRSKASSRAAMGSFVGRDAVLADVKRAVNDGARLITLLGPPGIGKTRVAEKCLEQFGGEYADAGGAWFCDLTQAKDARDLVFAVLALFGDRSHVVHLADNDVDARAFEMLAESGKMLLILDNFEQLTFAAGLVHDWCRAAPELVVIVTSRERLAVDGEVVLELPPLTCPRVDDSDDVALASEAVQLFSARARAAGGTHVSSTRAIAELVRKLDGIPLAIELAAARTRVLSPEELTLRLATSHDVLAQKSRQGGERHATLAHAIDGSWSLMTREEQRALARCSVFAGNFSPSAAEKVIAAGEASIDLVAALRDKSLFHAANDGRLALYVSIREYATKKLDDLGAAEKRDALLVHAKTFSEMARVFNDSRTFQSAAPDGDLRAALTLDKENLAAALSFIQTCERTQETAQIAGELAIVITLLQAAPAETCADALSFALSFADDPLRVKILLARQSVRNSLGRCAECRTDLETLLAMPSVEEGIRTLALTYRGVQLRYQGFGREAWTSHEAAARALERLDLPRLAALNTACMGRLKCDFFEPGLARELNLRALDVCEKIGDTWLGGLPLANLAQLEQEEGHFERAEKLLEQALARFRAASEPHYEAVYASAFGDLYFEWDKPESARKWYAEAARFFGRFTSHRQTAVLHAGAGALEAMAGNAALAEVHLDLARKSALRGESPIARLVVEIHAASIAIYTANQGSKDALRESIVARAHELLHGTSDDAEITRTSLDVRFAMRMLQRTLGVAPKNSEDASASAALTLAVAKDCAWFQLADQRADLARRGSLKRILRALVDLHLASPNAAMDRDALLAHGWPGERLHPDAASKRLRVAVATLRSLGLRSVLVTRDDGYMIDPRVRIAASDLP